MKSGIRILPGLFLLLVFFPCFLAGHTNLFYPGDAYFGSILRKDKFAKDPDNPARIQFGYSALYNARMPCGRAGYGNLTIQDKGGQLRKHLKAASELLWLTFAQDAEDWGGYAEAHEKYFPLFIYNKDFDLLEEPPAIKFNERSEEIQEEFGVRHAVYNQFDEAPWMTVRDVMYAKDVPPLKLAKAAPAIPDFKGSLRDIDEPVIVDSGQIQIAILVGDEYQIVDFANSKRGLTMIIVTESGVNRHELDRKRKWQPVPLNAPRNDYIDKVRAGEETADIVSAAIKLFEHRHGLGAVYKYRLDGLVKKPEKPIENPELWTPLLHKLPLDPWGRPFRYSDEANALFSAGPDGIEHRGEDGVSEDDDEFFRIDRE